MTGGLKVEDARPRSVTGKSFSQKHGALKGHRGSHFKLDALLRDRQYPLDLEQYEIKRQVGKGAGGVVYLATCKANGDEIALKVLDLDSQDLDVLVRETRVMRDLRHPNLIPLYASFVHGAKLYMVLPFLRGGSLLDLLQDHFKEGLDEDLVASVALEVLKGLDYLHSHDCMHRDIKAANVLIGEDGRVMLSDLGITTTVERSMPAGSPTGSAASPRGPLIFDAGPTSPPSLFSGSAGSCKDFRSSDKDSSPRAPPSLFGDMSGLQSVPSFGSVHSAGDSPMSPRSPSPLPASAFTDPSFELLLPPPDNGTPQLHITPPQGDASASQLRLVPPQGEGGGAQATAPQGIAPQGTVPQGPAPRGMGSAGTSASTDVSSMDASVGPQGGGAGGGSGPSEPGSAKPPTGAKGGTPRGRPSVDFTLPSPHKLAPKHSGGLPPQAPRPYNLKPAKSGILLRPVKSWDVLSNAENQAARSNSSHQLAPLTGPLLVPEGAPRGDPAAPRSSYGSGAGSTPGGAAWLDKPRASNRKEREKEAREREAAQGVARCTQYLARTTFCGTPCFMAPEVLEQTKEGYLFAADIWSYGMLLLELALGRAPYAAMSLTAVILTVLHEDSPTLGAQHTQRKFSEDLHDLVRLCLQKDPKARPCTAELLRHRLFKKAVGPHLLGACLLPQTNTSGPQLRNVFGSVLRSLKATAASPLQLQKRADVSTEGAYDTASLSGDVVAALRTLRRLARPQKRAQRRGLLINCDDLARCEGLAFCHIHKDGDKKAAVGKGHGFLLARKDTANQVQWADDTVRPNLVPAMRKINILDHGVPGGGAAGKITSQPRSLRWTAPSYFEVHLGGLGVPWEVEEPTFVLIVLLHKAAVAAFTDGRGVLDRVPSLAHDSAKSAGEKGEARVSKRGVETKAFGIVEDRATEVNLARGKVFSSAKANTKAYGTPVPIQAVIKGDLKPPCEFEPLYQLLDSLAAESLERHVESAGTVQPGAQMLSKAEDQGSMLLFRMPHWLYDDY